MHFVVESAVKYASSAREICVSSCTFDSTLDAFIIEELTELREDAVLLEFERIAERGGVLDAVRVCSLGQITNALFEVDGQYRCNM